MKEDIDLVYGVPRYCCTGVAAWQTGWSQDSTLLYIHSDESRDYVQFQSPIIYQIMVIALEISNYDDSAGDVHSGSRYIFADGASDMSLEQLGGHLPHVCDL